MKRFLKILIILLLCGSMFALGYVYAKITSGNDQQQEQISEEERQRNLDWLEGIQGFSDSDEQKDEEEEEQATSTEDGTDETATSTEDGTGEEEEDADDEEEKDASDDDDIEVTQVDDDRERSVENLGKADALESTVYDHAFDQLILYAELADDYVSLEWEPSTSASFDEYKIVRSTTDENPYYPKTTAIKTISNIDRTTFTDQNVEPGTDYYYRVCFTKTSGRPGCGNILKITF